MEAEVRDELKPCPFCGGEADMNFIVPIGGNFNTYMVGCLDVECRGTSFGMQLGYRTVERAIEAWNRRPSHE